MDGLDAPVLGHLPEHAAVPAPDDEHLARGRVREQWQVDDHLLVGHLVALRALDDAVEDQHLAVGDGLEEQHVLEIRARVVQHLLHLQREALACGGDWDGHEIGVGL